MFLMLNMHFNFLKKNYVNNKITRLNYEITDKMKSDMYIVQKWLKIVVIL
jgi:hypothetical protein